jgi:hypothetical protein
VTRARAAELAPLAAVLVAQWFLFTRPVHSAVNYDEAVYLAALDALRHGQALGSDVFAAQFPGFYDLLRGISYVTGVGVAAVRYGLVAVMLLGTVGAWLTGRRFGGPVGGLLAAAFVAIAPPLDLFGYQVIADTPALALTVLAVGLATLSAPAAAVAAGAILAAAISVKLTAVTAIPLLVWLVRRRLAHAAVGGAAVGLGLVLAHVTALSDLWTSGVTYHEDARSTPALLADPHRRIFDQIPHGTPFFVLALIAILAAVAFAGMRSPLRVWPLWTWVVLGIVFLLLHAPLHLNHLVVFPFTLAVAAGATLGAAVERLPRAPALAAVGVLTVVVAGAFVQQFHRVDLARIDEPASNVAAARALDRLVPAGALTVDDRPIISFLAHRQVVGRLVDLALLRYETGSLTDARTIDELGPARAVIVSRTLRMRPSVLAYVRRRFTRRYDRGGVQIYVR